MSERFSDSTRKKMSESAKKRCDQGWRAKQSLLRATPMDADKVRSMYESGMTQIEIARSFNVTQKVIHGFMKRNGIKARVAAKRNQHGSSNSSWAGESACYSALHYRVYRERGRAVLCEKCGTLRGRIEWANKTGNYADTGDYESLCVSCHRKADIQRRNATGVLTSGHISRTKVR